MISFYYFSIALSLVSICYFSIIRSLSNENNVATSNSILHLIRANSLCQNDHFQETNKSEGNFHKVIQILILCKFRLNFGSLQLSKCSVKQWPQKQRQGKIGYFRTAETSCSSVRDMIGVILSLTYILQIKCDPIGKEPVAFQVF